MTKGVAKFFTRNEQLDLANLFFIWIKDAGHSCNSSEQYMQSSTSYGLDAVPR